MDGYVMKEQNVKLEPNSTSEVVIRMEKGYVPPGMVLIPAGEFPMGTNGAAPDEMPRRTLNLAAFYIDKFEVTNQDFAAVFPSHQFEPAFAQFPVGGVSWIQAKAYAEALGKRLPAEAEWEKAARGPEALEYPWGNTFNPEYCNVPREIEARLQRIGSYRQWGSPYGCMDMAGNVYEWVSDWYDAYQGNTAVKTQYGQVYRVLRGGSYTVRNAEFDVRCAARHYDIRDAKREDYGFRCALDFKP
ncbi:MAG: SUMF1/EgtB/PvdO family nonheme iron enzyme, partial [Candidatus Hydrogenedentota bacterium]